MSDSKRKAAKKQKMLVAIAVVSALALLSAIFLTLPHLFIPEGAKADPAVMLSDKTERFFFYKPEYDLDIDADPYYAELDRYVRIKRGGEEIAVTDGDFAAWGEAVELFGRYFTAAIHGDAETYNSLFTENYYHTVRPYESFAPQRIYGITVEELSTGEMAGDTKYVYNVTYAISHNDGTFRADIDSDAFKTLIFTLVPENGTLKIDSIGYYRQK